MGTQDTQDLLKDINLRFSSDSKPGFTSKIKGKRFLYYDLNGKLIKDKDVIDRINKLSIPPAYKNVWICPYPTGYLQATGYDDRKRKQYRYHPKWIKVSQEEKFEHIIEFARQLTKIRKQIKKDLRLAGLQRQKIMATIVWLLENTLIRVGNEEYAKKNKSFGLTTLKNRHVSVSRKSKIVFQFKGKSGVIHNVRFYNKKVANILRKCKDLPGQDLFQYLDDNKDLQTISSDDINEYLKIITDSDITAKDFRTWGGTIMAAKVLDEVGVIEEENATNQNIVDTVKKVASHLRNKPATCRKYYIHPSILEAYTKGYVLSNIGNFKKRYVSGLRGLEEYEKKVVSIINSAPRLKKLAYASSS